MVGVSGSASKRRLSRDASISPPTAKRRPQTQSNTTKQAVASFFTPTSQKAPERINWQERSKNDDSPNTLLVGKYTPANLPNHSLSAGSKRKIAAFDFDSTLISTRSGKKFAGNAEDWKWWHHSVPKVLRELCLEQNYLLVIVSNQGGLTLKPNTKIENAQPSKLAAFKRKANAVMDHLDIPIALYAATEKDVFRKPRSGMWNELLDDNNLRPEDIDLDESVFVGDAAGRLAEGKLQKDFSCSDRNFAENLKLKFQTPEEFFLKEAPRKFVRDFEPASYVLGPSDEVLQAPSLVSRRNEKDMILFCGSPGAGKSTTYWSYLQPLGYERVNQDTLKTRDRCLKAADEYLRNGRSVAVDNTNADAEVRKLWVELAKKHHVPIRCMLFTADVNLCEHNNAVRALNAEMSPERRAILPGMAFAGYKSRYQRPDLAEGFQDIVEVEFQFRGTTAERTIWSRYWI